MSSTTPPTWKKTAKKQGQLVTAPFVDGDDAKICISLFLRMSSRANLPMNQRWLVGGFNPFEKYESKWESSPSRGEHKKNIWNHPTEDEEGTTIHENVRFNGSWPWIWSHHYTPRFELPEGPKQQALKFSQPIHRSYVISTQTNVSFGQNISTQNS